MAFTNPRILQERSLADRLIANLDSSGRTDFLTLLFGDGRQETLSYPDLLEKSSSWTHFYQTRGLEPGDRIIIILKHSIDLYASFIGAILGGFVPSMFAFPSPKFSAEAYFKTIGALVDNAQPRALVMYPELRSQFTDTIWNAASVIVPEDVPHGPALAPAPISREPADIAFLQYSSGTTGLKKGVAISHSALMWQVEQYSRAIKLSSKDVIV